MKPIPKIIVAVLLIGASALPIRSADAFFMTSHRYGGFGPCSMSEFGMGNRGGGGPWRGVSGRGGIHGAPYGGNTHGFPFHGHVAPYYYYPGYNDLGYNNPGAPATFPRTPIFEDPASK